MIVLSILLKEFYTIHNINEVYFKNIVHSRNHLYKSSQDIINILLLFFVYRLNLRKEGIFLEILDLWLQLFMDALFPLYVTINND